MQNSEIIETFKLLHDKIKKRGDDFFKIHDLTFGQCHVLKVLMKSNQNILTLKELEKKLGVAQSTTVGIVSRLEKKKYIEILHDENDKRIKKIKLTPLAIEKSSELKMQIDEINTKMLNCLNDKEKEELSIILKKLFISNID